MNKEWNDVKIEVGKSYRTRDGHKATVTGQRVKTIYDKDRPFVVVVEGDVCPHRIYHKDNGQYLIYEQAALDLMEEWVDEPKTWGEMTPEEKGALLLAAHEHKPMEFLGRYESNGKWLSMGRGDTYFVDDYCYRIKPEPEAEEMTLHGGNFKSQGKDYWSFRRNGHTGKDTHKITFSLVDGEPDCGSIKMEKIRSNED